MVTLKRFISCTGSSEVNGLLLTPKGLEKIPEIALPLPLLPPNKCACFKMLPVD